MPSSFFCQQTAQSVWKTVACVSAAGMKRGRGRGKGKSIIKDYNKGQEIGVGRKKITLAGLNTPVISARKFNEVKDLGENQEFRENLAKTREMLNKYRKVRENPLDRGWAGRSAEGRQAGRPDDHNETSFEGFESKVIMMRFLRKMSGVFGRTSIKHALVVTGNGNGLAGFADARGKDSRAIVRHARNLAAQKLVHIKRYNDHTVMHDFFSRYYQSTVFVQRQPEGHGIRAQRAMKAICEAFGIKDIKIKIEGHTKNTINLTKALFLGLMNQRSYQDIADEKGLHLVDMREENFYFPHVLASPKTRIKTDKEIQKSRENLDFTYFIQDGKIKQVKPPKRRPFEDHPMYYKHLSRRDFVKNREKTRLLLAAKYGNTEVKSVFPYFKTTAASYNNPKT